MLQNLSEFYKGELPEGLTQEDLKNIFVLVDPISKENKVSLEFSSNGEIVLEIPKNYKFTIDDMVMISKTYAGHIARRTGLSTYIGNKPIDVQLDGTTVVTSPKTTKVSYNPITKTIYCPEGYKFTDTDMKYFSDEADKHFEEKYGKAFDDDDEKGDN